MRTQFRGRYVADIANRVALVIPINGLLSLSKRETRVLFFPERRIVAFCVASAGARSMVISILNLWNANNTMCASSCVIFKTKKTARREIYNPFFSFSLKHIITLNVR